jgi:hypothetical protein
LHFAAGTRWRAIADRLAGFGVTGLVAVTAVGGKDPWRAWDQGVSTPEPERGPHRCVTFLDHCQTFHYASRIRRSRQFQQLVELSGVQAFLSCSLAPARRETEVRQGVAPSSLEGHPQAAS